MNVKFKIFKPSDWVMLYNSKLGPHPGKLRLRYVGPYKCLNDLSQSTFQLAKNQGNLLTKLINGVRLKSFHKFSHVEVKFVVVRIILIKVAKEAYVRCIN